MCSTPFGNQRFVHILSYAWEDGAGKCSTPFGNQRFVHHMVAHKMVNCSSAQRLSAIRGLYTLIAPQSGSSPPCAQRLSAIRGLYTIDSAIKVLADEMCSTPFGNQRFVHLIKIGLVYLPLRAQRLSAIRGLYT